MARPKSEDKRNGILAAAAEVFAERGLSAPTSAISNAAGIAEGTLFTYFPTKDELMNALYREIKIEMAHAMIAGYPRRRSIRHKFQHIWESYVDWGIQNPTQHKTLRQIEVWSGLTEESKKASAAAFGEIQMMVEEAKKHRLMRDVPQHFAAAAMSALAETTMEFIRQQPGKAEEFKAEGFQMLWTGIAK